MVLGSLKIGFVWAENGIYSAMIAPGTPYAIKVAIWYQGESNWGRSDYFSKLQAFSAGWSQVFNVKDIPFYQVQIAPFDYTRGRNPNDSTLCADVISYTLGLPKRAVSVLRGQTNPMKCLLIEGLSEAELREQLDRE